MSQLDLDEEEPARVIGALDMYGNPACWSWPLPDVYAFRDTRAAEAFLRWWNRLCAVCEADSSLVLDHDHETEWIRGYICQSCNGLEAYADDDADVFGRYRIRNPASMLGVRVAYSVARRPLMPSVAQQRVVVIRRQPRTDIKLERAASPSARKGDRARLIAVNLRAARERARLSQRETAELMRKRGRPFHQQTIARIERGQQDLTVDEAAAIAEIYGVTVGEIIGDPQNIPV